MDPSNPEAVAPLALRGVIFDWAGTVIDFGSRAPVAALLQLFAGRGIAIDEAQARGPMGRHKREHIRELLGLPEVAAAWQRRHGSAPNEATIDEGAVDALYRDLLPLTLRAARENAGLIPGVAELASELRRRGLRIGSTTGYNAEMMAELVPLAAAQGYSPDAVVTVSEVPAGRPAPWMCFRNAERLNLFPMAAVVKVGDTPVDIAEGLNAGMWTIGLCRCGNEVGLSEAALQALPATEQQRRIAAARERLLQAGAHYVVENPGDILEVLPAIEARLRKGERP